MEKLRDIFGYSYLFGYKSLLIIMPFPQKTARYSQNRIYDPISLTFISYMYKKQDWSPAHA